MSVIYSDDKAKCRECKWGGRTSELLTAMNPFGNGETIYGCPLCKSVDSVDPCCGYGDCWKLCTCGTPTPNGYRHTCGDHTPEDRYAIRSQG